MSLIMQKNYRSKVNSSVNKITVFGVIFAFGLISIGLASFVVPEIFGFEPIHSFLIVVLGAGVLMFTLSKIIMTAFAGVTKNVSLLIALMMVTFVLILLLIGSGILEVNI